MARYTIEHRWPEAGRIDTLTRARRDAAEYLFRRQARDHLIAGWAGLDTKWGWDLWRTACLVAGAILRGVPVGWEVTIASEHPYHGGESLTIRRDA